MQQIQTRQRGFDSLFANVIKGALAGAIAVYVIERLERMAAHSEFDERFEPNDVQGFDDEPVRRVAYSSNQDHLMGIGMMLLKNKGLTTLANIYTCNSSAHHPVESPRSERL